VEVRGYLKEGNNGKEMASGAYFMDFFSSGGSFVFAIALWLRCCCFVKTSMVALANARASP
jgi:hypothetical protein